MNTNSLQRKDLSAYVQQIRPQRGLAFGVIILTALLAFELFNYSTTDYALSDLLGELEFLGVRWATILAIAFCGIDFAGIARLFTPENGKQGSGETWYLFGAWLLAATMNAMLTWWGVSLAVLSHETLGNAVVERQILLRIVPIFVAVMVWLIWVLIIGSFSVAGERIFSQADQVQPRQTARPRVNAGAVPIHSLNGQSQTQQPMSAQPRSCPSPKPVSQPETGYSRPEPTYHPLSMSPSRPTTGAPATRSPLPRSASQMRR